MADDLDVALQMPSTDAGAEATRAGKGAAGPGGDNPLVPPEDSTTRPRDQREISEATRKAIRAIAEAGKKADAVDLGGDEDLVPMEHEPAITTQPAGSPARAVEAQAKAEPAPATAPQGQPQPPAAQPAAPAADPGATAAAASATAAEIMARAEADRIRADVDRRAKDLEAREAALKEREKRLPDQAAFAERPAAALVDLVRNALGLTDKDDAELREVISDIVTEVSVDRLGVQLPDEVKAKLEGRKAVRTAKALTRRLDQRESDIAAQREAQRKADEEALAARDQADRERKAISLVRDLVGGTKDSHPFLHAAGDLGLVEDPSAVVVELIRAQRAQGQPADWQAAVKLANDHFRPKVEAAVKRSASLSTLLNPAPAQAAPAQAAPAAPATQQVGEQVPRPKTLTTTPTAPVTEAAPDDTTEYEDRHDQRHRNLRRVWAKHKGRFQLEP